jgi:acetylornithine deacetylase/succinyl-diaminopimelate desuccinylase-like protein
MAEVDSRIRANLPVWLDEVSEFCRIPSETGRRADLEAAAAWTAARLARAGGDVRELRLDGVPPLLLADFGRGSEEIVLAHHYDVQPAGDPTEWTSVPYEPRLTDGRLFARGAADNKGGLLARLWGIEVLRSVLGALPCRVRILVEGEEESGSQHLEALLGGHARPAAVALIEGGLIDPVGRPRIICGMRGLLVVDVSVRTIDHDAHSAHAVYLPNAIARLVAALATLHDDRGLPSFDGLHADVRPPSEAQLALVDAIPDDDLAAARDEYRITSLVAARSAHEAHRAMTFEPTCNIQGIWGGYQGQGMKNIVPHAAHARLDLRLVPDQAPTQVLAALRSHLDARGFQDVDVTAQANSLRAYFAPPDHAVVAVAASVSEEVLQRPAIRQVAESGAGPMAIICAPFAIPMVSLGGGRDDCRAHAPDEHVRVDDLEATARMMARFVHDIGHGTAGHGSTG